MDLCIWYGLCDKEKDLPFVFSYFYVLCPTYSSHFPQSLLIVGTLWFRAGYLGSSFLEENKSLELSCRKLLMTFLYYLSWEYFCFKDII